MTIRTEKEIRQHKKHIENIIENLTERLLSGEDYNITSAIKTLEDEVEVLK